MTLDERVQGLLQRGRTLFQIRAVAVARDDSKMREFVEKLISGEIVVSADIAPAEITSADEVPVKEETPPSADEAALLCDCGSGLKSEKAYDDRDIFLTTVCEACRQKKLAKFKKGKS